MLSMCARMAAASAARSSWVSKVTAFATGPAAGLTAANRAAPRMNDKREEIEIRRVIIVTSESQILTPRALRPSQATRRPLRLCAFAPLREPDHREASFSQRRKGAKAQSSQRYFPELSIYAAAL